MYRREIVFFFSHHTKFSRFIGFLIPTILKYSFCIEVVLLNVRKVLLLSSLSENVTLYFTNLDFDISSSGSITHLPFKQSISKILLRSSEILISVEDQGMGIAKKHLPRLFERFYGVDKARSRTMGGTGLELAIVKHIARAHGGDVNVASTRGQGSPFIIHLPIQTKGFGNPIWTCCRHGHRCR